MVCWELGFCLFIYGFERGIENGGLIVVKISSFLSIVGDVCCV